MSGPVSHCLTPAGKGKLTTPEALQGDAYPIENDSDGYPELPACLDRA
jgi:hypothetical protein